MNNSCVSSAFQKVYLRLVLLVVSTALTVLAVSGGIAAFAPSASASAVRVAMPAIGYASTSRSWPLFGNNVYSDCTIAAVGDLIQAWNVELGEPASTFSNAQAINMFKALGGSVDQGVAIDAVLGTWQTNGLAGTSIASDAQLDNTNVSLTEQAIYLLGGVIAEAYLTPQTELQLTNGQTVTSTTPGSPSLAHALTFIGYNSKYLTAVTFGHVVHVSWTWWLANGVLEYGVIPQSFESLGHGPVAGLSTSYLTSWLTQQPS